MSKNQVCPWCDTEIVWDEEIGPEENCPHCLNPLGDYRTVNVELDTDGEEETVRPDADLSFSGGQPERKAPEIQRSRTPLVVPDQDYVIKDQAKMRYEETVERYLESQDEVPECVQCREFMLYAGDRTVHGSEFRPFVPDGADEPFLQTPFVLRTFVCPSCFHVSFSLSDEDRLRVINNRW
ncbi:hypothetical protein [Ferviditalea candida]|uniref:Uncharacterized protein n=1 Tax=Ferviditalea candida TaxID=3108399 RepID=A0ABU5ZF17_9BACL|nr:hypothetical protein [Paenibacillaceae bacterium T2]